MGTALVDLINQKRAGKPITPKERPRAGNVVDLMEILRRGVGAAAETKAPKRPAKKTRKATGQKEMLMPIEGKEPAKETAAKKPSARLRKLARWLENSSAGPKCCETHFRLAQR